ncbi:MAG: thiol:disulfide interchange protein DsbA/DsbL [Lysobacter sp.]|nr:thiol:disulfide interchange protein DsbA/DsbL [Lysobacter sp.]
MRLSISVHDLPTTARRGVCARAAFALLLIAASLFASTVALAQAKTPVAGVDYQVLETPVATASGRKIEVLEFFNYACGHCNDFSSTLTAWKRRQPKDVAIRYEAAPYGGFFDEMARAFYAARILGVAAKTHDAIFRDVHGTHAIRPGDKASILDAYARLGVDRARFGAEYDSARVDERLRLAKALMIASDVGGVPSLIVAGRYRIDAGEGISFESMLATADHLIRMERARIARAKR